jgi:MoxR-like ATPase
MKFFKPSSSDTGTRIAASALAKTDFAKKPNTASAARRNVAPPRTDYSGHNSNIQAINEAVAQTSQWVRPLQQEMSRVIVGQQHLVDRLLVRLIANGHLLLEGVPGLAKTLSLKTLAAAIQVKFQRLQFTPDMLPADIVATMTYNPREGSFHTKHGPVFSNLILADEINRAPAKVQSALLEAMQERQVTLGEETHKLPDPFLVMATQNPLEQEGTYPLPETQVDRFMLKVIVGYPSRVEERAIQDMMSTTEPSYTVNPVVTSDDIIAARRVVNTIYIDDKVKDYIVDIVAATRLPEDYGMALSGFIQTGASPRATIYLTLAARASAFLKGRGFVTPQDVKDLAPDVLRHRVTDSHERKAAVELQALRDDLVRLGFVPGRKPTVEDSTVGCLSPEMTQQESGFRIARSMRVTRLSSVQRMANLVEEVRRRLGEVLRPGQQTEALTEKIERTESIKPAEVVKPTQKLKRSRTVEEALQSKPSMRHKRSWSISPSRDTGHSRGISV